MQFDWKRIGMIALFFAALGFFAFFLYAFFWKPFFVPTTTVPEATTTPGALPGAGAGGPRATTTPGGGLTPSGGTQAGTTTLPGGVTPVGTQSANILVSDPAYYSSVTADGGIAYWNQKDGKFYRVDASGNISALSSQVFNNVSNAVFDHAGKRAVIQYPDGTNTIYDFAANKQITLPDHWQNFRFSPNDQNIAFINMGLDPANRFLVTAKYDGTNVKIIESVGENADKVIPNWSPDSQVVATYNKSATANTSEIIFIGQNDENFKALTVQGRDFRGIWSPDSQKMLYSVYDPTNNYLPQLWISDASGNNIGNNRQKISLNTWADRCTFAGSGVAICTAPQTLPYGAGLAPETTVGTADRIWAINLSTGQTVLVNQPQNVSAISNLMFTASSPNSLFFTGKYDNKIYKINLTP